MSRPDQVAFVLVVYAVGLVSAVAGHPGGGWPATPAIAWSTAALACAAVSIHVINEWADHDTDALTRRTAFSGGSGALLRYDLPRSLALRGAVVAAALSIGAGAVATASGGASLVVLLVGLVGGWAYSVPPTRLSRRGLGEIDNALLGGLVLPLYGISVVRQPAVDDALAFVPFTLLVLVNLLETQWSDREADQSVGKLTLVARLSPATVRRLGAVVAIAAYGTVVLLVPEVLPVEVAAATLAAAPLSVWGLVTLTRRTTPLPSVLAMVVAFVAQGLAWLTLAT